MLENYIRQYLSSFGIPFTYDNEIVVWENIIDKIPPTQEEINNKIAELKASAPMRLLKEERNQRIAESDWRFLSDQTPSSAWIDYRQALRDLPANSTPELEEDGNLINVDWPVEPTE